MLSLRRFRIFREASDCSNSAAISSSLHHRISESERSFGKIDEPALVKLKNERDPEKLYTLFKANAHNRLVIENRFAFEDMVSRLSGAGRFDYIEDLLEHQKSLPQGKREGFMARIIMLYGRAGMSKHAVDTFQNMHLYGCKRSVKSFNAVLKVLAQSRDLNAIELFLRDVPVDFSIKMDIVSVNTVIKAFCEMNLLHKAYLVMVGTEKLGISPDVITYTTLISASYKAYLPEIANGLWNLMVFRGCQPNSVTLNVRIQFLVDKGRAWEANNLLMSMHSCKYIPMLPDEVAYLLVIKGFFKVGNFDMALRVYSEYHNVGYKPNQKLYQTMVHYLSKAGYADLAFSLCKDSMKRNWFPSVETIVCLLECLQKSGKVDEAKHIYSLALDRVPVFSPSHIETMKSILSVK